MSGQSKKGGESNKKKAEGSHKNTTEQNLKLMEATYKNSPERSRRKIVEFDKKSLIPDTCRKKTVEFKSRVEEKSLDESIDDDKNTEKNVDSEEINFEKSKKKSKNRTDEVAIRPGRNKKRSQDHYGKLEEPYRKKYESLDYAVTEEVLEMPEKIKKSELNSKRERDYALKAEDSSEKLSKIRKIKSDESLFRSEENIGKCFKSKSDDSIGRSEYSSKSKSDFSRSGDSEERSEDFSRSDISSKSKSNSSLNPSGIDSERNTNISGKRKSGDTSSSESEGEENFTTKKKPKSDSMINLVKWPTNDSSDSDINIATIHVTPTDQIENAKTTSKAKERSKARKERSKTSPVNIVEDWISNSTKVSVKKSDSNNLVDAWQSESPLKQCIETSEFTYKPERHKTKRDYGEKPEKRKRKKKVEDEEEPDELALALTKRDDYLKIRVKRNNIPIAKKPFEETIDVHEDFTAAKKILKNTQNHIEDVKPEQQLSSDESEKVSKKKKHRKKKNSEKYVDIIDKNELDKKMTEDLNRSLKKAIKASKKAKKDYLEREKPVISITKKPSKILEQIIIKEIGAVNNADSVRASSAYKDHNHQELDAPPYYSTIESWVYAIAKKAFVLGCAYFCGYMGMSAVWLIGPVIFLAVRDEIRRRNEARRSVAKAFATGNEKDIILAKLGDLPAWIIYPDIERAEWLNRIFNTIWANVSYHIRAYIKEKIEPAVAETVKGFKFDRIVLGTIPPKIGGVKVYDRNTSRDEIVLDLDIFYAGNSDITFSLKGVRGGLKDFQMHGIVRVVLKPLLKEMPLFGGIQIYFLNNPYLDFNLLGVIDLLDMPGLRDMLRYMFVEQIAAVMVLPNKIVISLSDDVPHQALKMPEPEGVLRVHVVEAKNLINGDFGFLSRIKTDPYVIVNVGAQELRTCVICNNLNPRWDQWCEAVVETVEQTLFLEVWDRDDTLGTKDDNLGRTSMEISEVSKRGFLDTWLNLEQVPHGSLHLRLFWMTLSTNAKDLDIALQDQVFLLTNGLGTCLLTIFVDSATNLPKPQLQAHPNPYAIITVGNNTQKTHVVQRDSHPVWEEGFTFMVFNPLVDYLHIKVLDECMKVELGKLSYSLATLLRTPGMEILNEKYALQSSVENSFIVLFLRLRILNHNGPLNDVPPTVNEFNHNKTKGNVTPGDNLRRFDISPN